MKRFYRKAVTLFSIFLISSVSFSFLKPVAAETSVQSLNTGSLNESLNKYQQLNLSSLGISLQAFTNGLLGYNSLLSANKLSNDSVITIIDFSLTSDKKRLFVIDIKNNKLLFNTYVSHGKNSGTDSAKSFSNNPDSYMSSLGFYVTADTYKGKHGYSLRLNGEEEGINDNALERGIVMHAASYVSESTIKKLGYAGRSQGCPAIPENIYKSVIASIKNGSCLFIYSPDQNYLTHSLLLKTNQPFA